ncbi:MAG: metallophosphoesterase [Saprospiraceae bacterium]|nr:metallophosphoesterase [Saprospiraceae bacterium]
MKVWATSDMHIDYEENLKWFLQLSDMDYQNDILIIAGDISDKISAIEKVFKKLVSKFHLVLFVPGNHDLWLEEGEVSNSMEKFNMVLELAHDKGVQTTPYHNEKLSIIPMFSWYDFSFGIPNPTIRRAWQDFKRCKWPTNLEETTNHFLKLNEKHISNQNDTIISFSHFLPSPTLIPLNVPKIVRSLLPVLGSFKLGEQVTKLKPNLHIYGHSHLNRSMYKDGISYINNAYGYPQESHISRKKLLMVYEN